MSIDKTGVKYRASKIIAWIGFIFPIIAWSSVVLYVIGLDALADLIRGAYPDWSRRFVLLGLYPCCAVINYLTVGNPRLLPWKDIE